MIFASGSWLLARAILPARREPSFQHNTRPSALDRSVQYQPSTLDRREPSLSPTSAFCSFFSARAMIYGVCNLLVQHEPQF